MKLDLFTHKLYTNDGRYLKTLNCPFKIQLTDLQAGQVGHYDCGTCSRSILNTALLTDEELLDILNKDPEQCLKISLDQINISIYDSKNN